MVLFSGKLRGGAEFGWMIAIFAVWLVSSALCQTSDDARGAEWKFRTHVASQAPSIYRVSLTPRAVAGQGRVLRIESKNPMRLYPVVYSDRTERLFVPEGSDDETDLETSSNRYANAPSSYRHSGEATGIPTVTASKRPGPMIPDRFGNPVSKGAVPPSPAQFEKSLEEAIARAVAEGKVTAPKGQPLIDLPTVYWTRTGKLYHREKCQYLRESKIALSLVEAKKKGLLPCPECKPIG